MKKKILVFLFLVILCCSISYCLSPSPSHAVLKPLVYVGARVIYGMTGTWQIIKNKLIERKVVVGVTSRLEFEKLFNTKLNGGMSNQSCQSSEYCQNTGVLLEVEFDDKETPWNCNPNAKIIAPIVTKRGFCFYS